MKTYFTLLTILMINYAIAKPPVGVTKTQWNNIKRQIIQSQSETNEIDDNLEFFGVSPNYFHHSEVTASNANFDDHFGEKISISGNTMIVSAPYEDSNASGVNGNQNDNSLSNSGAVYVFILENNMWTQQAYLKASNPGSEDQFGGRVNFNWNSIDISGDTIVIGAAHEDSDGSSQSDNSKQDSGAAYVFIRNNGTWTQQAFLKLSTPNSFVEFGRAVAISGNTLIISSDEIAGSGAAYVFNRNNGIWVQTARLEASSTSSSDHFGVDLGISNETIVVGSYFEDSIASNSGAVYVYKKINGIWQEQTILKASNAGENDTFGRSVSISGNTIVVGASRESSNAIGINGNGLDNSLNHSGAAYVFTENNGTWFQQAYLKASNTDENDLFGTSVKINGNIIIVSAINEKSFTSQIDGDQGNTTNFSIGAAYVFERNGNTWQQTSYLKPSNINQSFIGLGSSVAFWGNSPVVSAQHFNSSSGKVYIYKGTDLIYTNGFE